MSRILSIVVFVIILILETGCNGGRSSGTSFLNSGVKPTTNPTVTPSSTPTSSLQGIKSFTLNGVNYIETESGKISDKTISVTTPVGTNTNKLTANITTSDGGVYTIQESELLNSDTKITLNPSESTIVYTVDTPSRIIKGYTIQITIPQTLFSCVADGQNQCGCLTQNDGSGLMWYAESPGTISFNSNFNSNSHINPSLSYKSQVESANAYLSLGEFGSHCGFGGINQWRLPTAESAGVYNQVDYYAMSDIISKTDQTDIGRLGYFIINYEVSSYVGGSDFIAWLNTTPSVTPPLYREIASQLVLQVNSMYLIDTPANYSGDYQWFYTSSGLVGYYGSPLLRHFPALGLLPVRGGQ